MQVEVKIDSSCKETKAVIITSSITEEVDAIVKMLSDHSPKIITGHKDEKLEILDQSDLIRIYASSGKVFAVTPKGEYTLRLRLYALLGLSYSASSVIWEIENWGITKQTIIYFLIASCLSNNRKPGKALPGFPLFLISYLIFCLLQSFQLIHHVSLSIC